MQKKLINFEFKDFWRNLDKKHSYRFFNTVFFRAFFFSLSSTSSLAGERLNKTYYFFFQNI